MCPPVPGGIEQLPGADLVIRGLEDLDAGRETAPAALVRMAAPRLRAVGITVPSGEEDVPGHRLYELLREQDGATAHRRYNALVARMSASRAAEHARPVDARRGRRWQPLLHRYPAIHPPALRRSVRRAFDDG